MDDNQSATSLEDLFHGLQEEVATLVADVHDLALYTKLNITGFLKILKVHSLLPVTVRPDSTHVHLHRNTMCVPWISLRVILHYIFQKITNLPLKPTFIQDYLEERPFYKYNWNALIVKLFKLYDLVRTRGHPVQGDSRAGRNQSAFVRQTTKYWVISKVFLLGYMFANETLRCTQITSYRLNWPFCDIYPFLVSDNVFHCYLLIDFSLVFNAEKEFEPKDAGAFLIMNQEKM
jgi:hypothetical protein